MLFESRIGCLDEIVPEETERFIRCINTMFVMTLLTMAMPRWMHQLFPQPWNIFCQCWDHMFDFGTSPPTRLRNRKLGRRFKSLNTGVMTVFCARSEGPHRPAYGGRGGEGRPRREGGGAISHLFPVTDQPAHEDRLQQRDGAAAGGGGHGRSVLVPRLSATSFPSRVAHLSSLSF